MAVGGLRVEWLLKIDNGDPKDTEVTSLPSVISASLRPCPFQGTK